MIKIVKPAPPKYLMLCRHCGCQYSYELSDLCKRGSFDIIVCPSCGTEVVHDLLVNSRAFEAAGYSGGQKGE